MKHKVKHPRRWYRRLRNGGLPSDGAPDYTVTGSDLSASATTRRLEGEGHQDHDWACR